MIISNSASSKAGIFLVFYMIFYDFILYYQDVTFVSAGLAVFVSAVFFLQISSRGVTLSVLALVGVFCVSNLLGILFSEYDLKYKYAFYRIFPLLAAWFVYSYSNKLSLKRLIVFACVLNVLVALYECFNGVDLFQSQDYLYYANYFGGVVRGNGLFWYSLVYSSFLLYSALLLLALSDNRKVSLVFLVFLFFGSVVSFNKMNCLLLGAVAVYLAYRKFEEGFLITPISKFVFFATASLSLISVFWFFGFFGFLESALDFDSAANSERFKFWLSGVNEFLNSQFMTKIFGVNLGVYERYGNGFESQYIQFLAEYGLFGCVVFIIMAWRIVRGKYYFQALILFLSFVTVRALDSYASAFLVYLIVFFSSGNFVPVREVDKNLDKLTRGGR